MIKLLLRFGFRSLIRQRLYTTINIVGLVVGMLSFMMIMLYVNHEVSFDNFHSKGDQIYRLISHSKARSAAITPYVWGKYLKQDLPEITDYTTVRVHTFTLKKGNDVFLEDRFFSVDSTFFEVFDFPVISGDKDKFLREPNQLVITDDLASRYFGNENPIGQLLEVNIGGAFIPFRVQGVVDCPVNSHLQFTILLPASQIKRLINSNAYEHWRIHFVYTYLLMSENPNLDKLRADFGDFLFRHAGQEVKEAYRPDLERLSDIYLKSKVVWNQPTQGNADNNRILVFVAFGVLLMAVINFINISSAQSLRRAKEVGVRKVFGSRKGSLITQFVMEAVLIASTSVVISIGMSVAVLPLFNDLTGKTFEVSDVITINNVGFAVLVSFLVGLVAGLYPALVLSSFRPIVVLRSRTAAKSKGALARKILVTLQFALAVILILSTGVIYRQVVYMMNKNLGFNKEQTISINNAGNVATSAIKTELLRQELLKSNKILSVSASSAPLGRQPAAIRYRPEGFEGIERPSISTLFVDHDYAQTYDLTVEVGRFFDRALPTDSNGLVINRAALKLFSSEDPEWLERPLEKKVEWVSFSGATGESNVIGIVENFNFESLKNEINPLIFKIEPPYFGTIQLKVETEGIAQTISLVESTWKRLFPEVPMEYNFINEQFAVHFSQDQELGKILRLFALLSVIVGVLGLFGLASFLAVEKEKEMSIRKVTGASEFEILRLLSWIFLKLVLVSNAIALPIGFLLMNRWLDGFAFRINMPAITFIGAMAISLLVTALTVGYHSLKTARVNPARTLAQE